MILGICYCNWSTDLQTKFKLNKWNFMKAHYIFFSYFICDLMKIHLLVLFVGRPVDTAGADNATLPPSVCVLRYSHLSVSEKKKGFGCGQEPGESRRQSGGLMSVFLGILGLGLIPLVRGVGVKAELSCEKTGQWSLVRSWQNCSRESGSKKSCHGVQVTKWGIERGRSLYSLHFFLGLGDARAAQEWRAVRTSQAGTWAGLSGLISFPSPPLPLSLLSWSPTCCWDGTALISGPLYLQFPCPGMLWPQILPAHFLLPPGLCSDVILLASPSLITLSHLPQNRHKTLAS